MKSCLERFLKQKVESPQASKFSERKNHEQKYIDVHCTVWPLKILKRIKNQHQHLVFDFRITLVCAHDSIQNMTTILNLKN